MDRPRQKTALLLLGLALAGGGLALLLAKRLPLPLRLESALVDFVAAAAILIFRRQNYRDS